MPQSHEHPALSITVDPASGVPLYRQIADGIAAQATSGVLAVGTRLPPTRALAEALSTHRSTVVKAFELLSDAGIVNSHVGRGTFIAAAAAAAAAQVRAEPGATVMPWASLSARVTRAEPLSRAGRYGQPGRADSIQLAQMQPPPELLPFESIRRCLDEVLRRGDASSLGYAPIQGDATLRALIAERLKVRGISARTDEILITTGSQQGLDIVGRALVDPGDAFLVEASTYSGAIRAWALSGATLIAVPSDAEGPQPERLAPVGGGAKGLYLMPDCHNPTGRQISEARRHALVAWSRDAAVPLIEDDYAADLNLDGTPAMPALRALDPDVIYLGTFSKTLTPALRVGYLVAPAGLMPALLRLKRAMDLGTSSLLQQALALFIQRGHYNTHLKQITRAYRERRDALTAGLRAHLPAGVTWQTPTRGIVLWLELPPGMDGDQAFEEARRSGVLVSPGTLSGAMNGPATGLRLTFAWETPERLEEGARRLGAALSRVPGAIGQPTNSGQTAIGFV